eukprot:358486-Chlamydomonas_euryale.AAC.11
MGANAGMRPDLLRELDGEKKMTVTNVSPQRFIASKDVMALDRLHKYSDERHSGFRRKLGSTYAQAKFIYARSRASLQLFVMLDPDARLPVGKSQLRCKSVIVMHAHDDIWHRPCRHTGSLQWHWWKQIHCPSPFPYRGGGMLRTYMQHCTWRGKQPSNSPFESAGRSGRSDQGESFQLATSECTTHN